MEERHEILRVYECSQMLRVKEPTIRAWIQTKKVPVVRIGRRVFIKRETVEKILQEGLITV